MNSAFERKKLQEPRISDFDGEADNVFSMYPPPGDTVTVSAVKPYNIIWRIGAFLSAAVCSLAMVRAAVHPDAADFNPNIITAVTSQTAVSTAEWMGASLTGEYPETTAAGKSQETSERTHTAVNTTSAAQTTIQTTAATTTSSTGKEIPKAVSGTRTKEELARAFAAIPLSNEAKLFYDTEQIAGLVPTFELSDEPLVLIMHTHGSEGYTDTDGRSEDIEKNVVAVGEALEATLTEYGIPVLHDERMYDVPSYTRSYNEAYVGIKSVLEKNPSVQIVLDIHRDGYSYEDGTLMSTAETFERPDGNLRSAKIMFLVGTDAGTLEHPTWRSHLAFAMALQTRLEDIVPGITRPVFLRRQRFNEHMTPGSLLVEIGSSGDSLSEAKAAVRVFGQALAEELLGGEH